MVFQIVTSKWYLSAIHLHLIIKVKIVAFIRLLIRSCLLLQGQGMVSLIHLAKNVNAAEIGWYEDVILDACCQNIVSDDEIWERVVQMSVLMVTFTQKSNPRSIW